MFETSLQSPDGPDYELTETWPDIVGLNCGYPQHPKSRQRDLAQGRQQRRAKSATRRDNKTGKHFT